jgi:hypothetical protein
MARQVPRQPGRHPCQPGHAGFGWLLVMPLYVRCPRGMLVASLALGALIRRCRLMAAGPDRRGRRPRVWGGLFLRCWGWDVMVRRDWAAPGRQVMPLAASRAAAAPWAAGIACLGVG